MANIEKNGMAQIRIARLEPGQEELVAQLHNVAFAEWSESLGPCFRYQPVSAETVTTWMRAPTDAVWVALLGKEAVGHASRLTDRAWQSPLSIRNSP